MAKDKGASLEEMDREATRRQDNLARDIDELLDRLNPKNAAVRWKNEAVASVKGFFVADDGKASASRVAAVAGGVIGGVVLIAGTVALKNKRMREK
ncbi:DUF3618 domain-containing protein [Devriesea agamarum]|uniref:DUF3618 domain-containing protein n=1 Tax=Devriesea agamarum TaxID=472569 RepID=UPI00071D3945|nr:DUF3618 domain-containing protein [Devriesea agamarum]